MANTSHAPLFETTKAKGSFIYKLFAASMFVGIVLIWIYRATHVSEHGRLVWIGMFAAELWFGFYWILTQAHRWNRVYRQTFKDRLSQRYENDLPGVDIFVCTADPTIEPPMMVMNTVLSVMAYDYPPEKLAVYLSDDAGPDLTFYALLEASNFSKHWIPYCKRFAVEPRSPEAHFRSVSDELEANQAQHLASVKMGLKYGCPVEDVITGLSIHCRGWKSMYFNPERKGFLGVAGMTLDQTLVQHKRWSEGDLQIFLSKHSPVWIGLGRINLGLIMGYCVYCLWSPNCFATLYYSVIPSLYLLKGDPLFPQMGLKYGCPVEDVITGLSIHCRGWKSMYFNPERKGFLGVAGTTLDQTLVQHKRWSEGDLQIFLSKHSPVWNGLGRINLGLIMGYCVYCLWSPNCFATLYYSIIPSLYLLKGDPLFPQVSSFWILPFVYVIIGEHAFSLAEYIWSGGTVLGWWNEQRIWLYKRTSSYLFAVVDTFLKLVGYSVSGLSSQPKCLTWTAQRYEQEKMEFGAVSPMFTVLSSLAMLNLFCLALMVMKAIRAGRLKSVHETMALHILLCGVLVLINLPLYSAAFFRKDKGRLLSSVTLKSILVALLLCSCCAFL
ncbi:Cellulose synthase-like protein E1 [Sesamum angolense]|uniref:Cellulose synthase-like protein E1 n=1 Tax=Sesamum angolense TaxID=2727404 RepID=A0AAE1W5A4_9LAMI|nr:Cellulose synthase-like protein E1 [Sesamum angolense]